MSDHQSTTDGAWAPDSCTLPTAERPLRVAEFDQFFAAAVRGVDRPSAQHLRLQLDGSAQVEETARDLTARESSCCSFFAFDLSRSGPDALALDVRVPAAHVDVLDALADRAVSVRDQG
ncbi:hypothetical protein F6X68_01665 [Micromonospora sp. AMSO12t]|uniref:hypothetical protein n=1 Tax=unclassified Micromonospora TaxID=2617518 RepID=UPI00124B6851|nr:MULTISPECIES: hypothetical protein [unclassified Micromonospora]KAB1162001.1 hypothetical protein F6X68_01665 [Micromonospora sp. AMSO12t]WSG03719.1 hypothetical protein OG989_08480 [Micromonospora sp. NBC_01740]